ncbi:PKD domain-containing protein [Ferruginibacter albus]|uniref:PKD domain-containing protein n=1 Tax=Ferruginibacter albus TaxID=2875540 RepID=UPI001CC44F00|nr:PKD domain-containing protein [Ferruginibacter albus]UAY51681.1 T9SS type A sorting domain-containing protein [Ferruginibacter albus]
MNVCNAQTFTPKYNSSIGSNIVGYYEYLPAGYQLPQNANKKYPVIFYFHGGSQLGNTNGNNLEKLKAAGIPLVINAGKMPSSFISGTDTFSYIIICPMFINQYPASDAGLVIDYILKQTSTYRIDPGKVYITGFSYGGRATWQYLMSSAANAKKIAAALPLEQFCYPTPDMNTMSNAANAGVALWDLHNSNDQTALPTDCGTTYVNKFNSYNPAIPAKITVSCVPSTSLCGHVDTTQNYIYNPSLFKLSGTSMSIYQWFYQYRQQAAGIPPVANAGTDQAITFPVKQATLNGTASSDADGTIASYAWQKVSGPVSFTLANSTAATATATNLVAGVYQFKLTVTDNQGNTAADTVKITVTNPAANVLPVANAGNDTTIYQPANSGVLNGKASLDSDGDIESYRWQKISGPSVTISDTTLVNPTINNLQLGTYLFQLTVTDNQNAVKKDTVQITEKSNPNQLTDTDVINCNRPFTIVVLGSSTSYGNGATPIDSSYVNRYTAYVKNKNSQSQVINLALGGYTTYQVLCPTGLTPPANRPAPDTARNITAALKYNPDAIIINLPTNDVANGYWLSEQKANYERAIALAGAKNVLVWVTTSQPRNDISDAQRDSLKAQRDWTLSRFGVKSIDFWTTVADTNGKIVPAYDYDDIHVNNAGHYIFFTRVVAEKILDSLCNRAGGPAGIAPVAKAGNDTVITLPATSITLKGNASYDTDGTITKYRWKKIGGPTTFTIADTTAAQTAVTNLVQGAYQFELTVTDNSNAVAKDTITVTVSAAATVQRVLIDVGSSNLTGSPDANGNYWNNMTDGRAGTRIQNAISTKNDATSLNLIVINRIDGTFNTGANGLNNVSTGITVNDYPASATIDYAFADPSATNGQWQFTGLDSTKTYAIKFWGTKSDATNRVIQIKRTDQTTWTEYDAATNSDYNRAAVFTFTGLKQVTFDIRVKSGSQFGYISLVDINITSAGTMPPNVPPVAKAGNDTTIQLPASSITLKGNGSFDSDGSISKYRWKKISGPTTFTITDTTAAQTTVTNLVQGTYQFELTVTDNSNATAKDTMNAIVNAATNIPPIAKAGNDTTIQLPANSITLKGSGTDSDGSISKYRWKKISGPTTFTITDTTAAQTTVTNLVQGTYQFELTVTDNSNATAKDTMSAIVTAATNTTPIAKAGNDTTIQLPANSITLKGSGTDADGTISKYRWKKISGPTTFTITDTTAAQTTVTGLVQGTYQFELTLTDNSNATAKDTMNAIVNAATNTPPIAKAGNDTTIQLPANSITLKGSGTDSDGSISKYRWKKISGPTTFTITDTTAAQTTVTGLVQGTYQFELTVTDNSNATAKDTMNAIVTAATNTPPIAKAGNDTTIQLPVNSITLKGIGTDSDGSISKYRWKKISGPTTFTITDTTAAQTTVTGLVQGTYQFELTVTDNSNATAKDTMNVIVNAAVTVSSQRVLIDVGSTNLTSSPDANGNYWNNMTDAREGTRVQNAKTTTNTSTTLNLVVVHRIDGTFNTSANGLNNITTGITVNDYPVSATADYAFADPSATNGQWQFTGLDSTKTYTIKFWGTKSDATNRVIQIKRTDQTTWTEYDGAVNNNYNKAAVFTFTGLKQVTFDIRAKSGSIFGYISVVDIKIESTVTARPAILADNQATLNVYPNPFSTSLTLDYNSDATGTAAVTIYNAAMQPLKSFSFVKQTSAVTQTISLNGLSKGVYFVELLLNNERIISRVIKDSNK